MKRLIKKIHGFIATLDVTEEEQELMQITPSNS
jgi:hypothetical protein